MIDNTNESKQVSKLGKTLEMLLGVLNLMYMHDGHIGEANYNEISKKITDLYQEVK